jgi:t-SNARE complex subunit (syntaxin)
MNREFIENHKPEELQRKLDFMKTERSRMMHTDELVELDEASKETPSGMILASDRHAIRNRILQQEQQELNEIERMVATIKRIATQTSRMILDQGMKLEIAGSSMRNARQNLETGRQELVQANEYQQDTNKKLFCFVCLIVVVVLVVLLITSSSKN